MFCIWADRQSFLLRFLGGYFPAGIALVVIAERRLKGVFALPANHFPSCAVTISTIVRINQKTDNCVLPSSFKEILSARPPPQIPLRSPSRFSTFGGLVKRMKNFVLLLGSQSRKPGNAGEHLAHSGLQLRQAF